MQQYQQSHLPSSRRNLIAREGKGLLAADSGKNILPMTSLMQLASGSIISHSFRSVAIKQNTCKL
jgi:hypothetical protein